DRTQCQCPADQSDCSLVEVKIQQKQVEQKEVNAKPKIEKEGDGKEHPEAATELFLRQPCKRIPPNRVALCTAGSGRFDIKQLFH
ncbi:MAG TPA: hypothetical protein VGF01_21095, partial [Terracidiphilus sp.]